jgi:hypothetical protein
MKTPAYAAMLMLALASVSLSVATGCSSDSTAREGEDSFDATLGAKSDDDVKRDIEAAANGVTYTSESDYPLTLVFADKQPGDPKNPNEATVRARFASYVDQDPDTDKPLATLASEVRTFAEWKSEQEEDCAEDSAEECAKMKNLDEVLAKNLRGIKVYYFGTRGQDGVVDGTAVSVLIIGRTPKGNYAGVRTIAIWT